MSSVLRYYLFIIQVSYIDGEYPVFQTADIWIYLISCLTNFELFIRAGLTGHPDEEISILWTV